MKQLLAIFHPDKTDNTWTARVGEGGTVGAHLSMVYYREEVCRKEGREDGTVGAHLSMVFFREEVCRKEGEGERDGRCTPEYGAL